MPKKRRIGSVFRSAIEETLPLLLESANNPEWKSPFLRDLKRVFVVSLDHLSRTGMPPFEASDSGTRFALERSPSVELGVDKDGLYLYLDRDDRVNLARRARLAGRDPAFAAEELVVAQWDLAWKAHLALILLCGDAEKRSLVRRCDYCGKFFMAKGDHRKGRPHFFCNDGTSPRGCRDDFNYNRPLPEDAQKRLAYQRKILKRR